MTNFQSVEVAQAALQQHYNEAHQGRPGLGCSTCIARETAVDNARQKEPLVQQVQAPTIRQK